MKKLVALALSLVSATASAYSFMPKKNLSKTPQNIELDVGNTVSLRGEVNDESISKLIKDIESNSNDDIYLFIQSPGGSVMAGMKAVSYIRGTSKKIVCIADVAISMAAVILQACDERVSNDNGIFMQHEASFGIRQMQTPNVVTFQKFIMRMTEHMDKAQAKRIGKSYLEFKELTRNDWWVIGEDLVTERVVDRNTSITCTKKAVTTVNDEVVNTPFGALTVSWSTCPLLSSPLAVKPVSFWGDLQKLSEITQSFNVRDNIISKHLGE